MIEEVINDEKEGLFVKTNLNHGHKTDDEMKGMDVDILKLYHNTNSIN